MGSPISPGEILELTKGIYHLYKKFHDAPEEMQQAKTQIVFVQTLMEHMESPDGQLDYLKSSKGKKL